MTTLNTPQNHILATMLIRTQLADTPNALRALAKQLEQEGGARLSGIPDTHFTAGSRFVEGAGQTFVAVTIIGDDKGSQAWEEAET